MSSLPAGEVRIDDDDPDLLIAPSGDENVALPDQSAEQRRHRVRWYHGRHRK